MRLRAAAGTAAGLLLAPAAASAHAVVEGGGAFYDGLLHALLVPAHLLLLVGLGVLLGQQAPDVAQPALPVAGFALPAGLVAGHLLLPEGPPLAYLLVPTIACGLLAALARPLPRRPLQLLAAVAAVLLGLGSAPAAGPIRQVLLAGVGTWVGAGLVVLNLVALASARRAAWLALGVRIVGSWTAAIALLVLALALRR